MSRRGSRLKNRQALEKLASYNQEVLFPAMEERFVMKTEFKDFRNQSLTNQDAMLKKLDILLTEKKVREYQEEKDYDLPTTLPLLAWLEMGP